MINIIWITGHRLQLNVRHVKTVSGYLTSITVYSFRILLACLLTAATLSAQDEKSRTKEFWNLRQQIESKFTHELDSVITRCREQGLQSAAEQLHTFSIKRDPQRQYIFLPQENQLSVDFLPAELPAAERQKVRLILNDHAQRIFELAKKQAETNDAAVAYRLLNEALYFDSDHQQIRKILGHRIVGETEKYWRIKADRLTIKKANKPFSDLGWPTQSYWIASTNHFRIVSRATESQTELLAESLERWHDVWRQVFFEYYNSPKNLNRWIAGTSKPPPTTRKFNIVFFANQQDYVEGLKDSIPGVELSTGFYNDSQKTSYFFASEDPTIHDTWRHELTHQLFQESRRSVAAPFQNEFLWLCEGIAMYFESLIDQGSHFTLGGFDARRLQYARLRRLKEQYRLPLADLSAFNQQQFQTTEEIAKVYSQSAGITHYLMDADHGKMRKPLIEFLQLSYRGRLKPGTFETLIGKSFQQIETEYEHFLELDATQLPFLVAPGQRRELALIGISLADNTLEPLGACRQLRWLDLSACDVRGKRLQPLAACAKLQQLFLTGSTVDEQTAREIAKLSIKEVDLSGSRISGRAVTALSASKTLETLNLSGTQITDDELLSLSDLPSLKSISIAQTDISSNGILQFKSKRPDVSVILK